MTQLFTKVSLVVAIIATVGPLYAAPDDSETQYRDHYNKALNLFGAEQYEDAIKEFQAAYVIKSRPRLLFNIGQSHRVLGNYKEALRFYLMYQAMEPNPKPGLRDELERYIARMNELIGAAENLQNGHEHDHEHEPVAKPTTEVGSAIVIDKKPLPPPDDLPRQPLYKRRWFWGVIGSTAAAALIVGLSVGLTRSQSNIPTFQGK